MRNSKKSILTLFMALSVFASQTMVTFAYDGELLASENVSYAEIEDNLSLTSEQLRIYNLIKNSCDSFIDSNVNLSTNAFDVVQLGTGASKNDIDTAVSSLKAGGYSVLDTYALYSSTNSSLYDKVVLFTKQQYRTADGRAELRSKINIVSQPQDIMAVSGTEQSVSVEAVGTGLKYQWQVLAKGATAWRNSASSGAATAKLSFKVNAGWNGAKLRCVVTDVNGKTVTSETATVTVTSALAITGQPQDITAVSGTEQSVSVEAVGTGLKYQWQVLTKGATAWRNSASSGAATAKLSFKANAGWNGAKLRCVVTDSNGKSVTSNEILVTVK